MKFKLTSIKIVAQFSIFLANTDTLSFIICVQNKSNTYKNIIIILLSR